MKSQSFDYVYSFVLAVCRLIKVILNPNIIFLLKKVERLELKENVSIEFPIEENLGTSLINSHF